MEPQGQHIQQQNQEQNEDSGSSSNSKSSFLCRQSSTRWTPTTDQIRILKDLYYNNGVRSPTAEQIQRISARLRQYGKIEGKNVFYWFQNHKARERQKKRFTVDMAMQQRGGAGNSGWKPEDSTYNKYTNINPVVSSHPPPAGVLAVGKTGSIGYGSVLMEKSFRDCSITSGAAGSVSVSNNNLGRVGLDSYLSPHTVFDKRKSVETFEAEAPEIETLPLFPMHGEDIAGYCTVDAPQTEGYYPFWYTPDEHENGNSSTSLELTLSSYTGRRSDSA